MAKVVLAMSGGVDSSVAAQLLLADGHEVVGVFLRHGVDPVESCKSSPGPTESSRTSKLPIVDGQGHQQGCCTASDAADAQWVAGRLGIPFYSLNLQHDFQRIIDYFVDQYVSGKTPNPCVVCNNWIKFGRLFDYADSLDAEFVATGHYARLQGASDGPPALHRGCDVSKDQSYVLFGIDRTLLSRMLLPVGHFHKEEIRRQAKAIGLRVADKRDSQEICFVASGQHPQFVAQRRPNRKGAGEIVTIDGRVVGHHEGIEGFTIGQRRGLRVSLGDPRFVVRLDPAKNQVVIGRHDDLARDRLLAERTNWLITRPTGALRCEAQIRYNSQPTPAVVTPLADDRIQVDFESPAYGVAPGQAVVCYDGSRVLVGGWIE